FLQRGSGRAGHIEELDLQATVPKMRTQGALDVMEVVVPRQLTEPEHSWDTVDAVDRASVRHLPIVGRIVSIRKPRAGPSFIVSRRRRTRPNLRKARELIPQRSGPRSRERNRT